MQSPNSTNIRFDDKMSKGSPENGQEDNSRGGQSIIKRVAVANNDKVENCSTEMDVKGLEFKKNDRGTEFCAAVNPNSLSLPRSQFVTVDLDTNALLQSGPDSPPSFGDAKGSDNDSYYQCSEHVRVQHFYALNNIFSMPSNNLNCSKHRFSINSIFRLMLHWHSMQFYYKFFVLG